jgi:hypothetical protein
MLQRKDDVSAAGCRQEEQFAICSFFVPMRRARSARRTLTTPCPGKDLYPAR